jgi:UDP-glucose 4-epimerase
MTTILINGIADPWGAALARRLSAHEGTRLLGLDSRTPTLDSGRAELISLPMRGEQLAELLRAEAVQTVIQAGLLGELQPVERELAKRVNVVGTLEILGACLHSQVQHLVIRSSSLIYGPDSTHPAFLSEQRQPATRHQTPWLRDLVEIEQLVAQFASRHLRPTISVLRLAPTVGELRSALSARLTQPLLPRPLGYDPRVQLLHSDDALAALEQAIAHPFSGAVNIAADPPLPLSRALRMAAARVAPLDLLVRAFDGWRHLPPLDETFLRYDCVVDTTKMREEFGFTPQFNAESALAAVAADPTRPATSAPAR